MHVRRVFAGVLGWLSRWLGRWAQTVEPPAPAPIQPAPYDPADGPPQHWLDATRIEPPQHWLDLVQQGAPELLDPAYPAHEARPPGSAPDAATPVERTGPRPLTPRLHRPQIKPLTPPRDRAQSAPDAPQPPITHASGGEPLRGRRTRPRPNARLSAVSHRTGNAPLSGPDAGPTSGPGPLSAARSVTAPDASTPPPVRSDERELSPDDVTARPTGAPDVMQAAEHRTAETAPAAPERSRTSAEALAHGKLHRTQTGGTVPTHPVTPDTPTADDAARTTSTGADIGGTVRQTPAALPADAPPVHRQPVASAGNEDTGHISDRDRWPQLLEEGGDWLPQAPASAGDDRERDARLDAEQRGPT